jgi:hypothetical protein
MTKAHPAQVVKISRTIFGSRLSTRPTARVEAACKPKNVDGGSFVVVEVSWWWKRVESSSVQRGIRAGVVLSPSGLILQIGMASPEEDLVNRLATWSAWLPFTDVVARGSRLPGVYLVRQGSGGGLVYVGTAGKRCGQGIQGRLNDPFSP